MKRMDPETGRKMRALMEKEGANLKAWERVTRERALFAALQDAAQHGVGFLRIYPDGTAERVASEDWRAPPPEDWRDDPNDRRHTQTAFSCGRCWKTKWFAGANKDFEQAVASAKRAGWVFADGWPFCSEKCRKAETGEGEG